MPRYQIAGGSKGTNEVPFNEPLPDWYYLAMGSCLGVCILGGLIAFGEIVHIPIELIIIAFIPVYAIICALLLWPSR